MGFELGETMIGEGRIFEGLGEGADVGNSLGGATGEGEGGVQVAVVPVRT